MEDNIRKKVILTFMMYLMFTLELDYADAQGIHDPSPPNVQSEKAGTICSSCLCCIENNCKQDTTCINGCKNGYHGGKCLNKCPANCKKCTDHINTTIWHTGYCTTDECDDGYYSTATAYQCQTQCPFPCSKCISDTDCKSCTGGYFLITQADGTGRCSECPDKCSNCDPVLGCTACEAEYFLDQNTCNQCKENCMGCTALNNCTTCTPGYFGSECQSKCSSGCKNNLCDKTAGTCLCKSGFQGPTCDICIVGWYGSNCSLNCPENCFQRSCNRSDGTCNGCENEYFDNECKTFCPINCRNSKCAQNTGNCVNGCKANYDGVNCTDCADGYFGDTCNQKCPVKCYKKQCERYVGTCNICIDNFTGSKCDTCNGGFYLSSDTQIPTDNSRCEACPDNCTTCTGSESCTECSIGYFGLVCKDICSTGCKDKLCLKEDGTCLSGCNDNYNGSLCGECILGRYGNTCDRYCSENCKNSVCERETGNCFPCRANFEGHKCDACTKGLHGSLCNFKCPTKCNASTCDRFSGNCSHGCEGNFDGGKCDRCIEGKYGNDCMGQCPAHCQEKSCNQTTGLCAACEINFTGSTCEDCIDGKYGVNCTGNCSKTCHNQKCTKGEGACFSCEDGIYGLTCRGKCSPFCNSAICDQRSGNCICKAGYSGDKCCLNNTFCETCDHNGNCIECVETMYGQNCETKCQNNCNGRCNRTDGTCLSCKAGFVGIYCDKSDKKIGEEVTTAVIAGGSAGGIVLFILVGLLAFFLYRRTKSTDTAKASIINGQTEKEFKASNVYVNQMALNDIEKEKESSSNLRQKPSDTVDPGDIEMHESEDEVDEPPVQENEYINTVRRIQTIRLAEYFDSRDIEFFNREFKELPKGMQKHHNEAKRPENQGKCRYGSIYPYDDTRVKLKGLQADFINASYINGYRKPKEYIACLGPTVKAMDKFVTFWHMVWQEKTDIIVMVTNLMEKGGMKCEQYWPAIGTVHAYGGVKVTCHSEDNYAEYTVRSFTLSKGNEQRRLHHIHFTAWPDKGVPDDVTSLIEFRQRVRATDVILGGPIIVHCSAGVGRTGTYIALDILTQEGETENNVNIFGCVFNLRHQRTTMVQTVEQYEYLHRALVHSLTYGCEPIPAEEFQEYVNTCSDALMNSKFDKLRTTKEHVSEDENDAIFRNKTLTDVNRKYADVPGDMYRPRLYKFKVMGESDFINATFVNSFKQKNRFIVCQTPLSTTVEDFLTLVLQENVTCIVSLDPTTIVGEDVGLYIPADNRVLIVGHFEVSTTKATTVAGSYTYRRITVKIPKKTGAESKDVHHYQFNNWSDRQKVPGDPTKFLKLITDTEKQSDEDGRSGHIIVHCLNAAERSGLFCAVSILLQKMEIEHEVSVVNTLRQVKFRRQLAIPNKEQYVFCHQCVSAYLQTFDSSEYANFTPKF